MRWNPSRWRRPTSEIAVRIHLSGTSSAVETVSVAFEPRSQVRLCINCAKDACSFNNRI